MKKFNQYLESVQEKRKIQNEEFEFTGIGRVIITIFKHRKEIPTIVAIMIAIIKHYYSYMLSYLTNNLDSFKKYKNKVKIKKLSNLLSKKIDKITDYSNEDYLKDLYQNWESQFNKLKKLDPDSANEIKSILQTKIDNPIINELLNKINN